MELKHSKLTCKKMSGTAIVEHPVENDLFLPDTLPDIEEVLQCETTVSVLDKSEQGEKIRVEGIVTFEISYRGTDGVCYGVKNKLPFSKSVEKKSGTNETKVDACVSYMNYRLIHERRMDIRGAVSIKCSFYTLSEESMIEDTEGDNVCLKRDCFKALSPVGSVEKRMTVREDLELNDMGDAIVSMAINGLYVEVSDIKTITNKVLVKGSVHLDSLLFDKGGKAYSSQHSVPFSQIIDIEGAMEDDCHCVFTGCDDYTVVLDDGISGKFLSMTASLNTSVELYRETECHCVYDAFSTTHDLAVKEKKMEYVTPLKWLSDRVDSKKGVKLTSSLGKILFAKGTIDDAQSIQTEEGISCKVTYHFSVYYLDGDGVICCDASTSESAFLMYDKGSANCFGELNVTMTGIAYALEPGEVTVTASFAITGSILEKCTKNVICGIDEKDPIQERKGYSMVLCFAKKGDSLWEIGKRYHVSPEKIGGENGCESDRLEKNMSLLIPMDKGMGRKEGK